MRNYENFLDGYLEYARDNYCPDDFHFWTGVSVVAGALGRKAHTLIGSAGYKLYPNLYIFLVASPGVGKSSAAMRGVSLLKEIETFKFIPDQVTEAKMIDMMRGGVKYVDEFGSEETYSSGYFYASEASNSFKPIYGDLISCFTDFYDCPAHWSKGTIKDDSINLYNVSMNILAGCTYDYLVELIPRKNIAGGFASRCFFIAYSGRKVRSSRWHTTSENKESSDKKQLRARLAEDIEQIGNLVGSFTPTRETQDAYEKWFPTWDAKVQSSPSENMRAFMARQAVNAMKLAMIISASEGNTLKIELKHWEKALSLVDEAEEYIPKIISTSLAGRAGEVGASAAYNIISYMATNGGRVATGDLKRVLALSKGFDPMRIDNAIRYLLETKSIEIEMGTGTAHYLLKADPRMYL